MPHTEPSPLSEAQPDTLEILFSRNPLDLTSADKDRIIAEFRRMRAKLAAEPEKKPRAKAAEKKPEFNLDDIID